MNGSGYNDKQDLSCRSKYPYQTRRDARRRAKLLLGRNRISLKPYRCPRCNMWHLFTSNKGTS